MDSDCIVCDVCQALLDLDQLLDEGSFKHHLSYAALVQAAQNGCELCQCIQSHQLSTFGGLLDPSFEQHLPPEDTQITCTDVGRGMERLRFGQEILHKHKHEENKFLWCFLDMFTNEDDPAAKLIQGRPITSGSGVIACRAIATRWLTSCLETHKECSHRVDNTLPRRVIDVGSLDGTTEPFLFVTNGQKGEWVTLSHYWGSEPTFISTIESIGQHLQSLPVAKLPSTYQDAIQITRQLGYQYLWIDSICILQDSRSDWLVESSQMHTIYQNAVLTIAASASISGHHGIFASRDTEQNPNNVLVALPCRSSKQVIEGTLNIYNLDEIPGQPLDRRAWALQEKALSRRCLIYASDQMHWACDTWSASEASPEQLWDCDMNRQISIFKIPKVQLLPMPDLPLTHTGKGDNGCLLWWYQYLDDYLQRRITFHSDRLPAIAGLAKEVASRTGYHYKAGLWEEDIHRGLLWEGYGYRVPSNYAPSWSWASIDKGRAPSAKWLGHLQRYVKGHEAKILETLVSSAGSDSFGQLSAARLVMNGRYREVTAFKGRPLPYFNTQSYDEARLLFVYGDQSFFWNRKHSLPQQIICTLDDMKDITAGGSNLVERAVIYFQVAKFASKNTSGDNDGTLYALMLEPTGRLLDEYRRIGIAEIPEDDKMAEGWSIKTVTVV